MPKGRPFKLPGFRTWLGEIKQVTAKAAAEQIVGDLVELGPWYSGQFARNWAVKVGDVRVPATVAQGAGKKVPRVAIPLPVVPSLRGTGSKRDIGYTIANRVVYRDVAMDLLPGRIKDPDRASAPQDWYRNYVEANGLKNALKEAVGIAINNPKIRGYSAKETDE